MVRRLRRAMPLVGGSFSVLFSPDPTTGDLRGASAG